MKKAKIIEKAARKLVELTPLFAVLIVFFLSSFVVPQAVKYTVLRMQIHSVENLAKKNGHYISGTQWTEDWGDGRRERYEKLNEELVEFINSSKVAKACNDYGTAGARGIRNIILIVLATMWILSATWIIVIADTEIRYRKRMHAKKRRKQGTSHMICSNREFQCKSKVIGKC